MIVPDPIQESAYLYCMVWCSNDSCAETLLPADCGFQEPSEPIDEWSQDFAVRARNIGWSATEARVVLCPRCSREAGARV